MGAYAEFAALPLGYLLGSFPSAYLAGKLLAGVDPRTVGSGNLGTANVYLNVNKAAGALTGFGDIGKGFAAAALAQLLGASDLGAGLAALGAFIGHCWPVWLHFRGGKGGGPVFGSLCWLIPLEIWTAIWLFLISYTVLRLLGAPRSIAPALPMLAMLGAPAIGLWLGKPWTVLAISWALILLVFARYAFARFVSRRAPTGR